MQQKKLISPFFVATVTIWTAWVLMNFTKRIYYAENPADVAYLWVKIRSIQGLNGIIATLLLFAVYRRLIQHKWDFLYNAAAVVSLTYLFSLVLVLFNNSVYRYFLEKTPVFLPWQQYLVVAFSKFFIILGLSVFFFLIMQWQALQRQKEKTLTAVALANEAQLQMLRYQLNPHFLFNALNSIRTLVHVAPDKADKMITDLSDFLRHTLSNENAYVVTLSDEMEIINNYLSIQKIRFEDRLVVNTDIADAALSFQVPCFLLHPLVENAIKYGLHSSPWPLRLEISATIEGNSFKARVVNTGKLNGDRDIEGCGTGLRNIRRRLKHFFPGRHSFSLYEEGGAVHAVITLCAKEKD